MRKDSIFLRWYQTSFFFFFMKIETYSRLQVNIVSLGTDSKQEFI